MNRRFWGLFLFFLLTPTMAPAQPRDPVPERALSEAAENGDQAKVIALLKQGADINKVWINDTPLEKAMFYAQVEMVKLLLDRGAKILPEDLAAAARGAQGDKQKALTIVKLLIAKGADVHANGADALSSAAIQNNLELVQLFLSKRADPNGKTESGKPALMEVVPYDSIESIRALLDAGASVKAVSEDGETILMIAARSDYRTDSAARVTLINLLIERGSDVHARDKRGNTALHYSVAHVMTEGGGYASRAEVVKALLDQGAEVNAVGERGATALMNIVQAWKSPIDISQLLIAKGADLNLGNQEGVNALMFAGRAGRSDLVQLLLEKGASLNARDKNGKTALVHALEDGQTDIVALLANKGADISPYKDEGDLKSALHRFVLARAVSYRRVEEVKQLLATGVDPNVRIGPRHVTPLMIASGSSNEPEIVKLLLAAGAKVDDADDQGNTALMEAAHGNMGEVVALLLRNHAAVNLQNQSKMSALMLAAEGGHTQIAGQLVDSGAEVAARDSTDRTALILASGSHSAQNDLVKLLLSKGSDVKASDSKGNTSLMLAAGAGAFQVIQTLINAGADVNAKNQDGWTALRFARESKEAQGEARAFIIKRLTQAGATE